MCALWTGIEANAVATTAAAVVIGNMSKMTFVCLYFRLPHGDYYPAQRGGQTNQPLMSTFPDWTSYIGPMGIIIIIISIQGYPMRIIISNIHGFRIYRITQI